MAQTPLPVSTILKEKTADVEKKKSREDWRKAKELEEARKAGTAPAAVDEEGKDINPHIPQYISAAPWYYGSKGPTLKHQRPQPEKIKEKSKLDEWYKRGVTTSVATKFRKGACENCGAMTHKRKDCLERPRKVGARFGGGKIAPDEAVQPDLDLDFESKRDRWNGYDPSEHSRVLQEFADVEEMKRRLKAEKLKKEMMEGNGEEEESDDDEEDEDKYVDDVDMPGTKVDSKQRITVRNLRIREDTAKYLRNLDPNSAYYDPKTRSMRDNPYKDTAKEATMVDYAGENFVRFSGDTQEHAEAQLFAWEAHEKGVDVHNLADPTKLEVLHREFMKKKDQFKTQVKGSILDKYGGVEHLQVPPKELLLAQTEDYVEYSRSGKIIKGADVQKIRSRYEEDVYNNNHTFVWGSFWKDGQWGYRCCHSFVKNSYCTGEKGIMLEMAGPSANAPVPFSAPVPPPLAIAARKPASEPEEPEEPVAGTSGLVGKNELDEEESKRRKRERRKRKKEKSRKLREKKKRRKAKEDSSSSSSSSSDSSSDSSDEDEDEEEKKKRLLKKALEEEDRQQKAADELLAMDERKRPYNSMYVAKKPTDEQMEAYFMKRQRDDDPMAKFV